MKSKTTAIILTRISTISQESDRQRNELLQVAERNDYEVIDVIEEVISGAVDKKNRDGLNKVLELARTGKCKMLMVSEVSRISRKPSVALEVLELLESYGCNVWIHSISMFTLLENGKRNPATSLIYTLTAELARASREELRVRVKSALAEKRRQGITLGRPVGSGMTKQQMLKKHTDVVNYLKDGVSIRRVAKIVGKGVSTVRRVRKILLEEGLVA